MVIEIPLTQDRIVLIDDGDLELVSPYAWDFVDLGQTSFAVSAQCRACFMHRLIAGAHESQRVDHRNGNGLDNRRANLRLIDSPLELEGTDEEVLAVALPDRSHESAARPNRAA